MSSALHCCQMVQSSWPRQYRAPQNIIGPTRPGSSKRRSSYLSAFGLLKLLLLNSSLTWELSRLQPQDWCFWHCSIDHPTLLPPPLSQGEASGTSSSSQPSPFSFHDSWSSFCRSPAYNSRSTTAIVLAETISAFCRGYRIGGSGYCG